MIKRSPKKTPKDKTKQTKKQVAANHQISNEERRTDYSKDLKIVSKYFN